MKIVIVGAGDVGSFLAKDLSARAEDVIVVDTEEKALERLEESTDVMTFRGNGTFRRTLAEIGVKSADLVVGVTSHDNTNMVISSLASQMGARRTLARVDAPEFFMTSGGIERNVLGSFAIICASRLVSSELLRLVRQIDMPFVETFSSNSIALSMFNVSENFRYLGKSIKDIDVGKGSRIIGVWQSERFIETSQSTSISTGDKILLASPLEQLPLVMRKLVQVPGRRGIIVGGGDVGYQLAKSLQVAEKHLTVIDINRKRCEFLADQLDKTTVVHGDGTSLALLQDEHVEMADYMLAVTRADEVNLMSSLVSQEVGVPNTYTLVHRPGYAHVYSHLGVKGTASAHELISQSVNMYFPNQTLLAEVMIPGTDYIAGKFQIRENLQVADLRVRNLQLPDESLLVGVSRSEEFYFVDRDSQILPGDFLLIVCRKQDLKQIEHICCRIRS